MQPHNTMGLHDLEIGKAVSRIFALGILYMRQKTALYCIQGHNRLQAEYTHIQEMHENNTDTQDSAHTAMVQFWKLHSRYH